MKKALIFGAPVIVVLAVALVMLRTSPCDRYGGFTRGPNWSGVTQCKCLGVKRTIRDQAPVDGITERVCRGVVWSKTCTKRVAGKTATESC